MCKVYMCENEQFTSNKQVAHSISTHLALKIHRNELYKLISESRRVWLLINNYMLININGTFDTSEDDNKSNRAFVDIFKRSD